jgi:cytochrome c oxidase assembly protein Cox11
MQQVGLALAMSRCVLVIPNFATKVGVRQHCMCFDDMQPTGSQTPALPVLYSKETWVFESQLELIDVTHIKLQLLEDIHHIYTLFNNTVILEIIIIIIIIIM